MTSEERNGVLALLDAIEYMEHAPADEKLDWLPEVLEEADKVREQLRAEIAGRSTEDETP
jgi:hypothetical protein